LGDHLRKRRLDLKLLQKDVAQKIGVDTASIRNWETGHATPSLSVTPSLIEFLGYIPFETSAKSPGERIKVYRQVPGLTRKDLAKRFGINPSTLARWEKGKGNPSKRIMEMISEYFNCFPSSASMPEE